MRKTRKHLTAQRREHIAALITRDDSSIDVRITSPASPRLNDANDITIDFREKRINIIFKTIYVFAAFFVALFLNLTKTHENGIDFTYVAISCLAAFCVVMIWKMVAYIFYEMSCFKAGNDLSNKQTNKTERCYSSMFSSCISSIVVALICGVLTLCYKDHFSSTTLAYVLLISLSVHLISLGLFSSMNNRFSHFVTNIFSPVALTIAATAFFLFAACSGST